MTIQIELTNTRPDAQKKGSWRLSEVAADPNDVKLGDMYVPKATLVELGWKPGQKLAVTFTVK